MQNIIKLNNMYFQEKQKTKAFEYIINKQTKNIGSTGKIIYV